MKPKGSIYQCPINSGTYVFFHRSCNRIWSLELIRWSNHFRLALHISHTLPLSYNRSTLLTHTAHSSKQPISRGIYLTKASILSRFQYKNTILSNTGHCWSWLQQTAIAEYTVISTWQVQSVHYARQNRGHKVFFPRWRTHNMIWWMLTGYTTLF